MRKLLDMFVLLVFLVPLFAVGQDSKERAIYFCHRDIDDYVEKLDVLGLGFLGREDNIGYQLYEKAMNAPEGLCYEKDKIYENARNFSTRLDKHILHFRHCFFIIADKIYEFPDEDKIVLSLEELRARGYGKEGMIGKQPASGGEDEETIKKQAISCVPIIQDSDDDKWLVSKQLGYEYQMPHLYSIWSEILDLMNKKERRPVKYNVFGDNCCTVAYDITRQLIGEQKALDLINPVSFNLYGMGVLWGELLGENTECVMATIRAAKGCAESSERCKQLTMDSARKCLQIAGYNTKLVGSSSKKTAKKIYRMWRRMPSQNSKKNLEGDLESQNSEGEETQRKTNGL